jgi:hypothetical protein
VRKTFFGLVAILTVALMLMAGCSSTTSSTSTAATSSSTPTTQSTAPTSSTPLSTVPATTFTTIGPPTLTIASPAKGAYVPAGNIAVTATVNNFNVVDKQGQANVVGQGHLHFYLDVDAPTTPGKPAIPASGVWAHVSGTTYTFPNVAPGPHVINVQLVNNDHTPVTPLVIAQVSITVLGSAPATTTTAPTSTPTPTPTPTPTATPTPTPAPTTTTPH